MSASAAKIASFPVATIEYPALALVSEFLREPDGRVTRSKSRSRPSKPSPHLESLDVTFPQMGAAKSTPSLTAAVSVSGDVKKHQTKNEAEIADDLIFPNRRGSLPNNGFTSLTGCGGQGPGKRRGSVTDSIDRPMDVMDVTSCPDFVSRPMDVTSCPDFVSRPMLVLPFPSSCLGHISGVTSVGVTQCSDS